MYIAKYRLGASKAATTEFQDNPPPPTLLPRGPTSLSKGLSKRTVPLLRTLSVWPLVAP